METSGELTAHLTLGAMVVYSLDWAKSSGWVPWLTADTKTLNRLLSLFASLVIGMGITWTGDAAGGWHVEIPMATVLMSGLWDSVKQFFLTQVLYDTTVGRTK